jgi:hypothetical protein
MIQKSISIILLLTMLTSAIGLELFQTARVLLNGEAIEYVLEIEEDTTEESKTKKVETKDSFDKEIIRLYTLPCAFESTIEKNQISAFYLMQPYQNHQSIQDLPPEV